MKRAVLLLCVSFAMLAACDRERVDVAEADDAAPVPFDDAMANDAGPSFPVTDGPPPADARCTGNPPLIGACRGCRNGFVALPDGAPTCECCPD